MQTKVVTTISGLLAIKRIVLSVVARLLYWVAIATIRLMQHLYSRRIINADGAQRFFRLAKIIEQQADRLRHR